MPPTLHSNNLGPLPNNHVKGHLFLNTAPQNAQPLPINNRCQNDLSVLEDMIASSAALFERVFTNILKIYRWLAQTCTLVYTYLSLVTLNKALKVRRLGLFNQRVVCPEGHPEFDLSNCILLLWIKPKSELTVCFDVSVFTFNR